MVFGQEKTQPTPIVHSWGGVRNGSAVNLPKPPLASCGCQLDSQIQIVKVAVNIDESGNIAEAQAVSGHPFYRQLAEQAARSSKFSPSIYGEPRKVYTELVYTFNFSERTVFIASTIVKFASLGIINGRAIDLPKPEYPKEAKEVCAKGKVEIEVLIDEHGHVIEANPISGDEFLWNSSIQAAKKARFQRHFDFEALRIKGIIVYDFDSFSKCVSVGIVNKKALSIPKPQLTANFQIKQDQTVRVQIVINENGNVIRARAISGHPFLRGGCENSARLAKFPPTFIEPGPLKVKAFLVYKFKPDGKIEF